jgi:HSP20 family protein
MLSTVFANDIRTTLDHFRRSVDQLFDSFYGQSSESTPGRTDWTFSPAVESGWTNDRLWLRAIVPGVPEKDLKVSVQNNQLVIEGERKVPERFQENAFRQLAYGRFYTSVNLPNGLDLDKITCRLHDGILDVEVPVSEAMKPRQIQIQSDERKALSA